MVNQALETLPPAFREVIVLKEIDDLSYKEIAEIADIPIGTVMSRLARGRKQPRQPRDDHEPLDSVDHHADACPRPTTVGRRRLHGRALCARRAGGGGGSALSG